MDKRKIIARSLLLGLLFLNPVGAQETDTHAHAAGIETKPVASAFFDTLKEVMTGTWEGRYTNGTFEEPNEWGSVRVEYQLTARGTALIENYLYEDSPAVGMTTVYMKDRNDLRLTHYCGAANHPSMVATTLDVDTRSARFDFTHITNLQDGNDYHSRQYEVTIVSDDHVQIQYHGLMHGKIASQAYDLKRASL